MVLFLPFSASTRRRYPSHKSMSGKFAPPSEHQSSSTIMTSSNYYVTPHTDVTCKQEQSYAMLRSAPRHQGLGGQHIGPEIEKKYCKGFVKTEQGLDSPTGVYHLHGAVPQSCPDDYPDSLTIKEEQIKPINFHYDSQSVYSQSETSIPSTSYQTGNQYYFQGPASDSSYNHQMAYQSTISSTISEDTEVLPEGLFVFIEFYHCLNFSSSPSISFFLSCS